MSTTNTVSENEQKALAVAADRKLLRERLSEARYCLVDDLRKRMAGATFDFTNKRLVSVSGRWCLQWKTRYRPDEPESYDNQQTSVGTVCFESVVPQNNDEKE